VPLVLSGLLSIAGALLVAGSLGFLSFLAVAGLSLLGAIYSLPIVPFSRRHLWRYSKIKDIPGSKTLSQALAWGAVIALLPLIEPPYVPFVSSLVAFFFVFSVVYVRSALFDIFQVQGDLIVGAETLPITLGEKRTLLVLRGVILGGAIIAVTSPVLSLSSHFSYALVLCYLALTLCLITYEKRWLHPGTSLEALVEGNLFLPGFLGLLWQWLK
jgi:4-hydroxybenzoate polyprenyltransferase